MDTQELRFAKYFTAAMAFVLLVLGGSLWPFTWWDMYSTSDGYTPPTQASRVELHVLDSSGKQHILRPMDLYSLDNDTSNQTPGHRLMQTALEGNAAQQAIYRPYLIRQIEFVLNTNVKQVEAWRHVWQVDFEQQPPLMIQQPTQTVFIDRFSPQTTD